MIHLVSLAKSFPRAGLARHVVLHPGSISLPTDRRLAVLGARRQGKTTLLNLLARSLCPDRGEVITAASLSPVANAGTLLHPQLTGLDNIRFIARAYGLDAGLLLEAADSVVGIDFPVDQPLRTQLGTKRKSLEAAIIIVLPFDCYLFDDAGQMDPDLLRACMDVAANRNAGFIFTTSHANFALQHADAAVIIREGSLRLFDDVPKAVDVFDSERQA